MLKRPSFRRFFLLILFAGFANPLNAQTISVQPGDDIQAAIDAAVPGDTVLLLSGTHTPAAPVIMKNGITLKGENYYAVTLEGRVIFSDADAAIENITLHYGAGGTFNYSNEHYTNWALLADTGVTAVNSEITVKNCVIRPHPDFLAQEEIPRYGKAVQIWDIYSHPAIAPLIEGNLILDADCGIFCFSQAFGGAVCGSVKNNTFYNNGVGILLRMHKENPHIYNNIFDTVDTAAVFYTYEDGALLNQRFLNINNNLFYVGVDKYQLWVDALQMPFDIMDLGQGNIEGDPEFTYPEDGGFYLSSGDSPAAHAGSDGGHVGAFGVDDTAPEITITDPLGEIAVGKTITVSGTVYDVNGIIQVMVNSEPAPFGGGTFAKTHEFASYGLNGIDATATDAARRTATASKEIYLYRQPIDPPAGD